MVPVRFRLSRERWKRKDPAFFNLTSWKIPAKPRNLEIGISWAHGQGMQDKTRTRMFQCSPGNTMLSHTEVFCYLWGIFFMFQYMFMSLCVCVRNPSPKENSFLDPWSLSSSVCGFLKAVAFVRNNTGDNRVLLIPCMAYEWKIGDFTDSKASRDHQTTPYFWPWCLWLLDEDWNSSVNEGKDIHCWKIY